MWLIYENSHRETRVNVRLPVSVARGDDLRGRILVEEIVHCVQEAAKGAIIGLLADGDERYWDSSSNTDCVLNVEVLFEQLVVRCHTRPRASRETYSLDASLATTLRIGSTVQGLECVRRGGINVRAELRQEALFSDISCGVHAH